MSDEGTKPPETGSGSDIGAMFWPARHLGVWLSGDAYADLMLEAIREREYRLLLEGEPRYGDTRPSEREQPGGRRHRRSFATAKPEQRSGRDRRLANDRRKNELLVAVERRHVQRRSWERREAHASPA